MPELPEVETTMRGLLPLLLNRQLAKVTVRAEKLRFPFPPRFAQRLTGATVTSLNRRAKYILIGLDSGETLLVHLGMSGRLVKAHSGDPLNKHDHVVIDTDKGDQLRFHDPRRFGLMDIAITNDYHNHKLLAAIGPEPLSDDLTLDHLAKVFAGKKVPVKVALLDQRLIAGLGNIYVSEALYYARIDPVRLAGSLTKAELKRLIPAIQQVLNASINAGGTSMRDYVQATGEMGHFQNQFAVYDRANAPCLKCRTGVQRLVQAGRATFFCPKCQK